MSWISPRVVRGNRGDIASRFCILNEFADAGARMEAVFASHSSHIPPSLGADLLTYGPFYNLWPGLRGLSALRRARYVVWTGGLDLQDDSSLLKLIHTWLVFASYRLLGLRILLAMQGAGPLQTRSGRWLASRVLALVDLALMRDRRSHDLLSSLTDPSKLRLVADGIFLSGLPGVEIPTPSMEGFDLRESASGPVIGLNIRLWFHFANSFVPYQFSRKTYRRRADRQMAQLVDCMAAVVSHLRKQHSARVVLVSMYEPGVEPWEDDQPFLDQIKARFHSDDEVLCLDDSLDIIAFARSIGQLDLMAGMRLHSTLIALRMGVPAVHIAYTDKGHAIYGDLGLEDWLVGIEDVLRGPDTLIGCMERVLADQNARARVAEKTRDAVVSNLCALRDAITIMEKR